ncbi:DUF2948 family protein [Rubellimicrobium arenae]|uniref:DUF2948 family protein n=1 Tax=Rubellimicrobium arenae TaxID=2817372 RepID=UPI001B303B39|nr:DUF2948 family protein [Rubellimicrobium arenae]
MTEDARFSDADEKPLRLRALDPEDLTIVSALVQDAVLQAAEIGYMRKHRRLAALVNRFRWEGQTRTPERVRSMLVIEGVTAVRSQGIDPRDKDLVLSLLSLTWEPGEDGAGRLLLTLAGDGIISIEVEALEVLLQDVTKPYLAPSRRAPSHPE